MATPHRPDDQVGSRSLGKTVGAGRYELGRQLGRGGMAEVSMAHDVRLGRTVAVKTLRPDLAQDPVARSRFGREAQNAASLNHPAIVSVYDTGEDHIDGEMVPFIVMECVEGRTVRELLADGNPIPQEQALRITEGVLEALEYSHRHGIIHRDIKPANVIITDSGAVKVMDFGIARAMHSAAATMTQTGMVMGTPQYLSPEQALGRTVDARSDLYSSGCMLYELLTLRPPFNGDTPLSVVYQHVQDDPTRPSQIDNRIPPHLDAIALRSLAKNPEDRYQSADEMRMDLRRALAGQPVTVMPPQRTATQANQAAQTARLAAGPAVGGWDAASTSASTQALGGRTGAYAQDGGTGPLPQLADDDGHGRRRRRPVAVVVAAVVAVAALAVVLALVLNRSGSGDKPTGESTSGGPQQSTAAPNAPAPQEHTQVPQEQVPLPVHENTEDSQPTRQSQDDGGGEDHNPGGGWTSPTAPVSSDSGGDPGETEPPTASQPPEVPPTSKPTAPDTGGSTGGGGDDGDGGKGGSTGGTGNTPPPKTP